MKKCLFFITLCCICLFFSCSKDHSTSPPTKVTPPGKKYTINFNVSASGVSTLNGNSIKRTDAVKQLDSITPVSGFATSLYYMVYNSAGNLITSIEQSNTSPNFGKITDTYSPGNYNIVLIAHNGYYPPSFTLPTIFSTGVVPLYGEDTFFKTYALTVSDTTATDQNIVLSRVDGQLQIVITDTIPTTAAKISVAIEDKDISISTGLPSSTNYYPLSIIETMTTSYDAGNYTAGTVGYTITSYIANTNSPFSVIISAQNSSGTVSVADTVNNITCQDNVRTILSGNLFANVTNETFIISTNNTWNPTPYITIPFSTNPPPVIKNNMSINQKNN